MSKVGSIGLGIMGAPMAGHPIGGGREGHLYARRSLQSAPMMRR